MAKNKKLEGSGVAAHIVNLEGIVTANNRFLGPGDALYIDEQIKTHENSTAKLLMKDKSVLDLAPSTIFYFKKYVRNEGADRNVEIQMELGKVRALIRKRLNRKGKFRIRTKSSVLAVRGTELVVDLERTEEEVREQITVVSGKVLAVPIHNGSTGKPLSLGAGQQLNMIGSFQGKRLELTDTPGSLQVVKIPSQQVKRVQKLSQVQNNTFLQTVKVKNKSRSPRQGHDTIRAIQQTVPETRALASQDQEEETRKKADKVIRASLPSKRGPGATEQDDDISKTGDTEAAGSNQFGFVNVSVTFQP